MRIREKSFRMSDHYAKPGLAPIDYDVYKGRLATDRTSLTLSGKDVLGLVQSALAELGPANDRIIAVKREVLEQVSEGRLAEALRTAIVGAARAG